jgi:hypothetical protein
VSDFKRRIIKAEKTTYYEEIIDGERRIRKETETLTYFPDGTTHHNPTTCTTVEYL